MQNHEKIIALKFKHHLNIIIIFKGLKVYGISTWGGGGMTAKKAIKANRFSEFFIRLAFVPLFGPFFYFFRFLVSIG